MPARTEPILARSVEARSEGLVIVTENGKVEIPWDECSPVLAKASDRERRDCELSPSGYGIHWRSIDEDLAVGPLIRRAQQA